MDLIIAALPSLLKGAVVTLEITSISVLIGTLLGTLTGIAKVSKKRLVNGAASTYIEIIRGTPLLLQIYFFYFGLGYLQVDLGKYGAAIIALAVNCGAYTAEIVRAGIQAIPRGQMEAARSLGMTYSQSMRKVILPQAFKQIIPPMVNEYTAILKDSSLVSVIALSELTRTGQVWVTRTFRPFEIFGAVGAIYLVMTFILSRLAGRLERRLKTE